METENSKTGVPAWLSRLSGATAYSAYLRAMGRDACVVPLPDTRDRGTPVQDEDSPASSLRDRHLVLLSRSPIHLVSLRAGLPDSGRIPLAYHYVVHAEDMGDPDVFDARLGQSFRGLFQKKRTRLTFVGGALADRLRGDDAVRAALFSELAPEDDVVVAPDPARGLVRIVHTHPMSLRRPLWVPHPTSFYERILPEALFIAIERIAAHVRSLHRRHESRASA